AGVGGAASHADAADVARGAARALLLAGARRDTVHRGRNVGPAAPSARPGDAALLLAHGGVLRCARVYGERAVRSHRLRLRLGGHVGPVAVASAVPPLCAGVSRAP